ncbi:prepilin-type N-terminal cleavage/methylation domain-containing protein [Verminephrobacter eiseniae]|uniref:prepilin-type N-terminal cleavage/methylation domain-containing protein n=1 Tax=Verminephrobacter eiseniae TaxID=364317 RepID=UPI002244F3D1|nr:prepilin-type N-terminal cleavage/methylation domain-containing protein [Verminephrobacter eiseniae]MCW8181897.1 prepilin-type N-terminal cleavage/methylation domain-containing protein [Verminephrobacter eiseniae]
MNHFLPLALRGARRSLARGFTLLELMVVLVIIGMLPAVPDAVAPDAQALARLLGALPSSAPGAAAPVAAPPGRFALIGVLSGRRSGGGAALIAVDGKPARPFRIGAAVDQGLLLQTLAPRQARLGPHMGGPATVILDMPPRDQELPRP